MRMRLAPRILAIAALVALSACAPKTIAVPTVTTPKYPDFVKPVVPPRLNSGTAPALQERAWLFLQAGELRQADREAAAALTAQPDFFPAETTGGYVHLAQRDLREALTRFDRALSKQENYAPALAGKGQTLLALERDDEALAAFQAAVGADPSLSDIERQIEVLKFRTIQRGVAAGRDAGRSGNTQEAIRAYQAAIQQSPDSAFLYRELALIQQQAGNAPAAVENLRKAVSLDPSDAGGFVQLGELLEAQGESEAAMQAYNDAIALGPDARTSGRRDALRARLEAARLPSQYRAIEEAPQITRGDLAALVGVRLGALLRLTPSRDVGVITDIRNHWAEEWILASAQGGVLDAFANHTFQPGSLVRRVDFAQTITRLLARVALVAPAQAGSWTNARGSFSDIAAGHIAYPAASAAVAAGAMRVGEDRTFQPARLVTGAEAIQAFDRLRSLAQIAPDGSLPAARPQ